MLNFIQGENSHGARKTIIISSVIIVLVVLLALIFDWGRKENQTQEINASATTTADMPIVVNNIKDNQKVSNPIKIEGKARGGWYFEATFPIQLVDAEGNIIAYTTARAQSDWATTSFVDFVAELNYIKPTSTTRALIVLNNDNPSGNPDLDQAIFIPVILK